MSRRAADLLVDCLRAQGADRAFCVPGESYLSVLDALHQHPQIETLTCRHESGAGFMAVVDAKLTGRAGVCFVSRGPGASNAAIAVHTAEQDAVPLVLFIGQVPRYELGRGAFQEVDYGKTFADMAKGVWTVHDPDRLPEVIARAFAVASAPTPGPTVVVLPEDMLEEMTDAAVSAAMPRQSAPVDPQAAADTARRLAQCEKPLLIAGGALDSPAGREALYAAAQAHGLPVLTSFKRQDLFPNGDPLYAGHLGFKMPDAQRKVYEAADLLLAVGTRLGEVTSQGYRFPHAPQPVQPLIHVHPDPQHLNHVFAADTALACDPVSFLQALASQPATQSPARKAWSDSLHDRVAAARPWKAPNDGLLDMGPVVAALCEQAGDDAIFITDAGNFSSWLHRHFPFNGRQRLLGAVGGAMGIGMPAAVAAGRRHPGRQVITLIGDGGFLMTGGELATALQYSVPVKIFISDNGSYGTIRMHQERQFPERPAATDLQNPDFAKLAEAYGARGLTIERVEDAEAVVEAALEDSGPVVVHVRSALEHINAFTTLTQLRG
ncbi:thiamine pyrophosphate-dependent enzyme [Aquibaculum sediminis]|uniref:thiamine pyrophosphate-dependent enzyme n=1 Tax=Aquibaculum sediminis TaxID=3231907 RepID=UPI003456C8B5